MVELISYDTICVFAQPWLITEVHTYQGPRLRVEQSRAGMKNS